MEDAQKSYEKEKSEADVALAKKKRKDTEELRVDSSELKFREQQGLAAKGGISTPFRHFNTVCRCLRNALFTQLNADERLFSKGGLLR